MIKVRSSLSACVAASLLAAGTGAAAVSPATPPPLPVIASPAVQLSALSAALPRPAAALPTKPTTSPFGGGAGSTPGERIIDGYNALQPWVQYSVELGAWAVGYLPWPVGLAAPQMLIGYSGVEPLTRAAVYSLAYALDGQWDLIGPTVKNGIETAWNNVVQGELSWIASFFPPLPPIRGGAAVTAPKAAARATASTPAIAKAVAAPGVRPTAAATVGTARISPAAVTTPDPAPVETAPDTTRAPRSAPTPAAAIAAEAGEASAPPVGTAARLAPATRGQHKGTRESTKGSPGAASSARAARAGR